MKIHSEATFETAITESLVAGGYRQGKPEDFDKSLALNTAELLEFLQASQPDEYKRISEIHQAQVETKLLARLCKEIELRGCLDVIRKGFTDYGVHFKLAYFQPETSFNPEVQERYDQNILTVTRQVKYSLSNENSLDLVLFLNGIPVATAELKNQLSGQNVANAKSQFKFDRDPRELLFQFNRRALVHFVVDTDQVFLSTRLKGAGTFFLPFNQGHNRGAGNPPAAGYRTAYLWERIWAKDSWLDIVGKYLTIQTQEETINEKKVKKQSLIFPRFHQLDVVRKLSADVRQTGAGKNYLIQHSAGSGKSNSIAWLAYRLSNLHNATDERIFDTVIVVTDRKVLDAQLQDTIYQFEHKTGVVQKIDKDSGQLAEALINGTNIIITTLQKFPFILEKVGGLPGRKYAVIVDEAHSSQGGESAKKMKQVLAAQDLAAAAQEEADEGEEENYEDELRKSMQARGRQPNLSFFAFTATPKAKTLEVFGVPGPDGKPVPFHLYSMRQAIEEGFILDVLKGYTTYKLYFKLNKRIEDDPNIPKKKGAIAVARFVSLHPHNLAQKTEVIIEHFRRVTRHKIGGRAKAMVVTGSRLHAVRYKEEFDRYIREKGYTDLRTLVAFSGTVHAGGLDYTEAQMNGFGERELPEKFGSSEYHVLIVAEKYQTGFDQPLLHTMYVDKKLSGLKAVQTLSRLNRTCPGKEDTFVLDFANDSDEIQAAFQPYYEQTTLTQNSDPNHLYDLWNKIQAAQIIWRNEVEEFNRVYFKQYFTAKDQEKLNAYLDPAVERYRHLPVSTGDTIGENTQEDFKHTLTIFTRYYAFITQIVNFGDLEMEKQYTYSRFLLKKLPSNQNDPAFRLGGDEVALEYYRLQKVAENQHITLVKEDGTVDPPTEAGLRGPKEEKSPLSEIIKLVNDRFGTEFNDADRLLIEQIVQDCMGDETLAAQAKSNTMDNFKFGFDDVYLQKWIERMDQNKEMFTKVMDDAEFSDYLKVFIMRQVYDRLRAIERG